MKRPKRSERTSLELIEEAFHLLRCAPLATLAIYYVGTLPFVFGGLFFWADMSRDPFAPRELVGGALGMAALFVWMKAWQAVFAHHLRALAADQLVFKLGFRRVMGIVVSQTALQPTGLFLLPLSLGVLLPFGWVYAFYQNLTVLANRETDGLAALMKKARRQAGLWSRQNHAALLILFGFGFFVFLNCCIVGISLPELLKTLFGIESVFTRGSFSLFNSTFFAICFGLTYLGVDPIVKALYALRCFYGESQETGEDLKAEIRQYSEAIGVEEPVRNFVAAATKFRTERGPSSGTGSLRTRLVLAALLFINASVGLCIAQDRPAQTTQPIGQEATSPQELGEKIREVMRQRKYTWRMPREKIKEPESESGMVSRIKAWIKTQRERLLNWLRKYFRRRVRTKESTGSGYGWIVVLQVLLYGLVGLVLIALGWLLYSVIRNRNKTIVIASQPIQPAPDLTDENIGADQLPEDGWSKLGRELLARGELRLAMRAFYLASLAHLAGRNLITLAKFKSNRDYEREVARRAHAVAEVPTLFAANVSVFDRAWYGMHEVTEDLVTQFINRVERLRGEPLPPSTSIA